MKPVSLYIASTPWNFLNSFAFAVNRPEDASYLMYVDFPEDVSNIYLQALDKMQEESPFVKAWCFHGKYKGTWKKWRKRLEEIKQIQKIVAELKPDQVFVGSDRRIEFQCAMTEAVKHNPNVKGIYLDEGLFSYTCRKRSKTWQDRVLDSWIKRLMYPVDWKHPPTIGASSWISEGWLLIPEKACPILKKRILLKQLPLENFSIPLLEDFLNLCLNKTQLQIIQNFYDLVIILPHPTLVDKSLKHLIMDRVSKISEGRIAIKTHPRDLQQNDWLYGKHVSFLPSSLPFELLLPVLRYKNILSAPSTAVVTAKLMHPNANIELLAKNSFVTNLLDTFESSE